MQSRKRCGGQQDEKIDPAKWGWRTWLLIDVAAGLLIVALFAVFG